MVRTSLIEPTEGHRTPPRARSRDVGLAAIAVAMLPSIAPAADKPALSPDPAPSFATTSHISATIEFGLPALASAVQRDIPKRIATIDERVDCVHRRVLVFRVNANCDVWGFVDRTSPVSLNGRGDRVYGGFSIYGAAEGQGANRFTARIRGETEARATIEAEARPQLRKDWSLELNFADAFHWSEPPYLHVLGREIALAPYVEPRVRKQLAGIRSRALTAARRLDLRDKAARAWSHAFEPIKLADEPPVWLQLDPQSAAFAGVRANAKVLAGTLDLSGSAETSIGKQPANVAATPLPALGTDVAEPSTFDVILPVRIGYDVIKDKLSQAIATAPAREVAVRDVQVYPSSGKLVIGLRLAKPDDTDATAGTWVYFSAAPQANGQSQSVGLPDLQTTGEIDDPQLATAVQQILTRLKEAAANLNYGISYQNLLIAANERLSRPLKDGFRMEGHLASAGVDKVLLLADGITVAIRASGELKILYGL
jgi:hypothetical protein